MESQHPNHYELLIKYRDGNSKQIEHKELNDSFHKAYEQHDVYQAVTYAGNEGNYQKYFFFGLIFLFFLLGFWTNIFGYAFYTPTFLCLQNGSYQQCTRLQACKLGEGNYKVLSERESFITEFQMYCGEKRAVLDFYQSFIFLVASTLAYVVVQLTDKFGRLFGFYAMSLMYTIGPLIGYFQGAPFAVILSICFFYVAEDIFNQLNIIYFNEIASNRLRSKIPIVWTFKAFGSIVINFILQYMANYREFFLLSLLLSIVYILIIPFIIESPFYAFKTGNLSYYFEVLKQIGTRNSISDDKIEQQLKNDLHLQQIENSDEIQEIKIHYPHQSAYYKAMEQFRILFQPQYLTRFIFALFMIVGLYINDCITYIYPQKMGIQNIYQTMTIFGLCAMVSNFFVFYYSDVLSRKMINVIGFSILCFNGLILIFMKDYEQNPLIGRNAFFITCITKMVNDMVFSLLFNYYSELFPTKIRGFTSGLLVFMARLSNITAPTILNLSEYLNVHPVVVSSVPCWLSLLSAIYLPETLHKTLLT